MGKTTVSVAASIYGALQGKKVAAITIDPSKRLASALGLKERSQSLQKLSSPNFSQDMDVLFLDTEVAFQEFVRENLSDGYFEGISSSKIYQQISKNLRETHNFAALYQLDKVLRRGDYDLVVLDTPPCHQVIDFFQAPIQLQKFFTRKDKTSSSKLVSWFQEKGLSLAETVLKNIAGEEFIREVDYFFSNIGELRQSIVDVSQNVLTKMNSDESQFVLICSPSADKLAEAQYLQSEITKRHYSVGWCVMNRAYPLGLDLSGEAPHIEDPEERALYNYFKERKADSQKSMGSLKTDSLFRGTRFAMLPEMDIQMDGLEALVGFSKNLKDHWSEV
ncbi:MAG: ArsA family ATPase [Bdellovibrionales bacterium]|nr:ArsA family ATPase [Bdellovibrionales bacterium]